MADEAQDVLVFTMVNAEEIEQRVPAGTGQQELASVDSDQEWIEIDDKTRIQTRHIVSVKVQESFRSVGY